jgi:hypothetical protein
LIVVVAAAIEVDAARKVASTQPHPWASLVVATYSIGSLALVCWPRWAASVQPELRVSLRLVCSIAPSMVAAALLFLGAQPLAAWLAVLVTASAAGIVWLQSRSSSAEAEP